MNESFDDILKTLKAYLDKLYVHFTKDYDSTSRPNDFYTMDLKAYVLLSHAALEDFFEEIAQKLLKDSFENWKQNKKQVNEVILQTILQSNSKTKVKETLVSLLQFKINNEKPKKGEYQENLKSLLEEIEEEYSKLIHDNHSIKLEKLQSILNFLGIGLDNIQERLLTSLELFEESRGSFAHKQKIRDNRIKKKANFEDMKGYVDDIVSICEELILRIK